MKAELHHGAGGAGLLQRCTGGASIESLEGRTLLSVAASINFQTGSSPTPQGYLADTGQVYGLRSNGMTYGWNVSATSSARDRNSPASPDQPHDTLNHMQLYGQRAWEISLPNGIYRVRVVAGDPSHTNSVYGITAEGKLAVSGAASHQQRWFDNTVTVEVKDGRLTLGNAANAVNNKINFVQIKSVDAPIQSTHQPISWITIGGSSANEAHRRVGTGLSDRGWIKYVQEVIQPQINWGVRRFVLHNPFGTLSGETMQMDQYLHAQDAGLSWLTRDFARAWKPITDAGIEVVAYLGTMRSDADFATSNWESRFWASAQPALDAGMNVALDSAGVTAADSITYRAALLLEQRGVKVYIEPRPNADLPHWFRFPVIATDSYWRRSDPARFPALIGIKASNDVLTGEIIRVSEGAKSVATEEDTVAGILDDGHTPAFRYHLLQADTLEELLGL